METFALLPNVSSMDEQPVDQGLDNSSSYVAHLDSEGEDSLNLSEPAPQPSQVRVLDR